MDMNPHQLVPYAWPRRVKQRCFDLFTGGDTCPVISKATGVPIGTIQQWSSTESWSQYRRDLVSTYTKRAEALGQASILMTLNNLLASSKVVKQAIACLDSGTPLSPVELAAIASAISDSSELLCRLLGK